MQKKFSFQEAVSLVGTNTPQIKTALDLINFRPNSVTFNGNINKSTRQFSIELPYHMECQNTRGFIGYIQNDFIATNKTNYGLLCYKLTKFTQLSPIIGETSASILIGDPELPQTTQEFKVTHHYSEITKNEYYYVNKINYDDVTQSFTLVGNTLFNSDRELKFLYNEGTEISNANTYWLIFIDLKNRKVYTGAYNTETETVLSANNPTTIEEYATPKIMLNIGWYIDPSYTQLPAQVTHTIEFTNSFFKKNSIQTWLNQIYI